MSQRTKHLTTSVEYKDDGDTGSVVARFSTFDIVDREGDIVRASAFTDGQAVPMVWAHDWHQPIGKGVVRVTKDHARFEGDFFPTNAGQEARAAVRAMGDLQQWSWGFRVLDTQPNDKIRGYDVTGAEVFEVSPVLVGANQATATLAVKSSAKDAAAEMRQRMESMRQMLDEMDELMGEETDGGKVAGELQELAARIDELKTKHISQDERTREALDALAREQLALESIWLG